MILRETEKLKLTTTAGPYLMSRLNFLEYLVDSKTVPRLLSTNIWRPEDIEPRACRAGIDENDVPGYRCRHAK